MANTYDVGDLVTVFATFTTAAGIPQNPSVVKFAVKPPTGAVVQYTYGTDIMVVKDVGTGLYHVDVNITMTGTWLVRWWATGTGQAAGESSFYARVQKVPTT